MPALLAYLADHPEDEDAGYALAGCSSEGCGEYVAGITQVLDKCRRSDVRRSVLLALGHTRHPAAVAPLRAHVRNPEAAEGLGKVDHPDTVEALAGAMRLPLSSESLDAVLSAILTNPLTGEEMRREAARMCLTRPDLPETIKKIGDDPACRPELEWAAQSQEPLCRFLLATALGTEEAAPHYEFVSRCGDQGLLREISSKGHRLPFGLVEELARNRDAEVRWRLARSMRSKGKSIPVLLALLSDKQFRVREAAAHALDRVTEAFPRLCELFGDRSRKVRSAAVCTIGRLREVEVEERIRALARFLYDRAGRPIDLEHGVLLPFDGGEERPYMLSEALEAMEHPLANKVLEEWRQAARPGGT